MEPSELFSLVSPIIEEIIARGGGYRAVGMKILGEITVQMEDGTEEIVILEQFTAFPQFLQRMKQQGNGNGFSLRVKFLMDSFKKLTREKEVLEIETTNVSKKGIKHKQQ